jgi:putative phosphoesterase
MRLLLMSDIHANLEALHAILENVKYDRIFCMGDLVDYGPDPRGCIDWVRDNGVPTIRGNHDNAVALHVDCGCGYTYKHLSEASREYTWRSIGEKDEAFLKGLPLTATFEIDGIRVMMAHGSPDSFFDYLYPDTPAEKLESYVSDVNCDYLFLGHTHKPAVLKTSKAIILNPGSIGQPRDHDWRASCMVLDTETRKTDIIRIKYDIDRTCEKIRASMPEAGELEAILRRGY